MSYIDKQEYEERYGEHVGYCRVHHIRVLDTCQECEDDAPEQCAQCHAFDDEWDYTWAEIDGERQLLCWGCTDKLHKTESEAEAKSAHATRISNAFNVDYLD